MLGSKCYLYIWICIYFTTISNWNNRSDSMELQKEEQPLHVITPLIVSHALGKLCGTEIFLKMENVQPSGSFKIRGIGHLIQKKKKEGVTKLFSASGGNAGMATAYAGNQLGLPTTVIIPETTPKLLLDRLEDESATTMIHGKVWNEANEKALELSSDPSSLYVSPFDHPLIWEGHSSMLDEILQQCPKRPSAIVISVGGGGMLCGLLIGMKRLGIQIPIVAMETFGANCFRAALDAGKPVSIGKITSIAFTLGALTVCPEVFNLMKYSPIISKMVTDKQAIDACYKFLDDHRCLVETSCGATLAAGYSGIIKELIETGQINDNGQIVFVVCGGNAVTMNLLSDWDKIAINKEP